MNNNKIYNKLIKFKPNGKFKFTVKYPVRMQVKSQIWTRIRHEFINTVFRIINDEIQ